MVIVTTGKTIFGVIRKEFIDGIDATDDDLVLSLNEYINMLISNKVWFTVEFE